MFSRFSPAEIERRRLLSVDAMKSRDREEWERQYQQTCDRIYWTRGQCCAGCDHWASENSQSGTCAAAGIVSGEDVLRSIGVSFSSYTPPPGLPYTRAEFSCGKFRDDFDWSTLDRDYLESIGALRNGELRAKPQTYAAGSRAAQRGT
ncbi:hypothetical protein [Paracoccus sp. 22332]|uniref:hypothetical protein n=1 Tax=Paracoccus sp. 22332 TaxID=3453913 RepID=UPI003F85810B